MKKRAFKISLWFIFLITAFIILQPILFANESEIKILDEISNAFTQKALLWGDTVRHYAISLFWWLALIEFAYTAFMLALGKSEMGEFLAEFVKRILFIGIFYMILLHSGDWLPAAWAVFP